MPDFDRIRVLLHSDGLLHWERLHRRTGHCGTGLLHWERLHCRTGYYGTGLLHWEPGGIFRTTCDINIAYFPFDLPGVRHGSKYDVFKASTSPTFRSTYPGTARRQISASIAYFPFDSQRCPLLIGAYSYHSSRTQTPDRLIYLDHLSGRKQFP